MWLYSQVAFIVTTNDIHHLTENCSGATMWARQEHVSMTHLASNSSGDLRSSPPFRRSASDVTRASWMARSSGTGDLPGYLGLCQLHLFGRILTTLRKHGI